MLRLLVLSLFLGLMLGIGPAFAQSDRLVTLDTGDDSRGWEGVGKLDLGGRGMCTGAMIAPDLVLTAAHCLYDKTTSRRIDHTTIEFLAGWRNGMASAYRKVRRAVVHPDYAYDGSASPENVRNDLALLELDHPIRNTSVLPFETDSRPLQGDRIGIVSYAHDRAEVPSLQEVCNVLARREGVLVMSCDVDFGSSGAPVFSFASGAPRIVSVVSAKAEVQGMRVSLGTALEEPLALLRQKLAAGEGAWGVPVQASRVTVQSGQRSSGAKFVKP